MTRLWDKGAPLDERVLRYTAGEDHALDNRLILAGEHASWLPAWQEGAILSALDAVERLHRRVMAG